MPLQGKFPYLLRHVCETNKREYCAIGKSLKLNIILPKMFDLQEGETPPIMKRTASYWQSQVDYFVVF